MAANTPQPVPVVNIKASVIRLPHPWLTEYQVVPVGASAFSLTLTSPQPSIPAGGLAPPIPLHNPALTFTQPTALPAVPPSNDNSAWARARRNLSTTLTWTTPEPPTTAQVWAIIYTLFSLLHNQEGFRLTLVGRSPCVLRRELKAVGLAVPHPSSDATSQHPSSTPASHPDELLIPRDTFWQGAGSPFGARPAWLADPSIAKNLRINPAEFPLLPLSHTFTNAPRVYTRHPVRPQKPAPGSIIYSRFIPHLGEHFSMVAVDYEDDAHLALFHKWQNDPRVSAGWNETGTLEQHKDYLRRQHEDPHQLAVLARFDDEFFGYYEIYWAKEDHLGTEYNAGDYDRGRHSLVGELRFRGPHRVRAWWSGLMHYCFLEDVRTERLVGEPRATGKTVIAYDAEHGFHVEKEVDLYHKRSALAMVGREKFFQMCPLHWGDEMGLDAARKAVPGKEAAKL